MSLNSKATKKAAHNHGLSAMLRRLSVRRTVSASLGVGLILSAVGANAAGTIIYKTNDNNDLNAAGSFTTTSGGATAAPVPSTTTGSYTGASGSATANPNALILAFDNTLTAGYNGRTGGGTGATFAIDGILLTNPGGPVVISQNTGTTSIGVSGIDMSNAAQNLTFSPSGATPSGTVRIGPGVNTGISESWKVNTGTTLTINSVVSTSSGTNNLTLAGGTGGAGNVVLNGAVGQAAGSVLNLIVAGANAFINAANTYNGATTVSSGSLTESSASTIVGTNFTNSGTGVSVLNGTNTYTGTTTISGGTVTATNTQAFGNTATNAAGQITFSGGTTILNLLNDGGTGTVTGQTIIYGGPAASATGYNLTAASGTINVNNNGNVGSTNNTIQLGTFTFGAGSSTVNVTGANGYGLAFSGGLTTPGANNITISTNAPLTFAGGLTSGAGKISAFYGAGTVTFNGNLASTTPGTPTTLTVGNTTSGGLNGNVVLKGTSATDISQATVSGGSLTLYNVGALAGVPIKLQQANAGALPTGTLNLRSDTSTTYNNAITTGSVGAIINVDQATAAGTGQTLTVGAVSIASGHSLTMTGGNNYNLTLGAVTGTGTNANINNNTTNGTLTVPSFTETGSTTSPNIGFGSTSAAATTNITGAITQSGAIGLQVKKNGPGLLTLGSGTNSYTNGTQVNGGTVTGQTTAYGTGTVAIASGAAAVYTQATDQTYSANISGAGQAIVNGQGHTVTYTGVDSAAGGTTVNSGTVLLSHGGGALNGPVSIATSGTVGIAADNEITASSSITLAGGTLAANGHNEGTAGTPGLGTLTLSASSPAGTASTLDFGDASGTNANTLAFSDSGSLSWTGTVQLLNYTDGADKLYIGTTNSLTTQQLMSISFGTMKAGQDASGKIAFAPAPEPSGWASMLVGVGVLGSVIARKRKLA